MTTLRARHIVTGVIGFAIEPSSLFLALLGCIALVGSRRKAARYIL
jgi:hypothetical protein